MIVALDKCQKSLTDYLNSKRAVFPRFTFLSDDELLNILGSGIPIAIQEHVGKMFDNLDRFSGVQLREGERGKFFELIFKMLRCFYVGEEAKNGMDARFSREYGAVR